MILILLLCLLLLSTTAPSTHGQNRGCRPCGRDFDARCRLITAPCNGAPAEAGEAVFDNVLASGKPVVLYVHGRGREPRKTLKQDIIGTIERNYDVRVLMFNWDSGFPLFSPLRRPVGSALSSGASLSDTIERLSRYRESHPATRAVPVSLLVHSMGSIVLRSSLEGLSLATVDGPLFSNILITGSDEEASGYAAWVERLRARHAVAIAINPHDSTLAIARNGRTRDQQPLGRHPVPPLATNAIYLDMQNRLGGSHRLFEKSRQHHNVAVCETFSALLRGVMPELALHTIVASNERVRIPLAAASHIHPCFRGVADEPDAADD